MISRLKVKNFKSLKEVDIETSSLNLFMGLNGMGKSSLIQTILLLKQSNEIERRRLNLSGNIINIGKGKDALYQFAKEEFIEIGLDVEHTKKYNWKFEYRPEQSVLESKIGYKTEDINYLRKKLEYFQYLTADHVGPQEIYETNSGIISNNELGDRGEYTVHFLHVYGYSFKVPKTLLHPRTIESSLISQVNAWLTEISPGVKLNVIEVPHVDKVLLNYEFELLKGKTSAFKPANVGFGISFVLPVITSLLLAKRETIIILENPESHIHPRGQAELGKLMALAAANGAQLFIETHSDHIINGIRVAVKEGLINRSNVRISYFEKETTKEEQFTAITEIKVDKNGELSEYPKDFLDTWNNQLLKLI